MIETCPVCDSRKVRVEHRDHAYVEAGLPNIVLTGLPFIVCASCGESSMVIEQPEDLHKRIAQIFAKAQGPLEPGELRFVREYLGLSREAMALSLGVDVSTVSRWESGKRDAPLMAAKLMRLDLKAKLSREGTIKVSRSQLEAPPGPRSGNAAVWLLELTKPGPGKRAAHWTQPCIALP